MCFHSLHIVVGLDEGTRAHNCIHAIAKKRVEKNAMFGRNIFSTFVQFAIQIECFLCANTMTLRQRQFETTYEYGGQNVMWQMYARNIIFKMIIVAASLNVLEKW